MILLQTGPGEFFIGGTALSVTVSVDVETREGIAGIASVEEGSRAQGEWIRRAASTVIRTIKDEAFFSPIISLSCSA